MKIVHQIWGLCPADAGKPPPENLAEYSLTWQRWCARAQWDYKQWDRPAIEALMETVYPVWKSAFYALGHWVEQCDFARYVIVWTYGGTYADMDTVCKRAPREAPAGTLVVGHEAVVTDAERRFHRLARNTQICQWAFYADKQHPCLKALIDHIAHQSSQQCIVDKSTSTIMNTTGPGVFTDIVLSNPQNVTILGIEAFGCGQAHSRSPPETDPSCYIVHKFEGSWKVPTSLRTSFGILKKLIKLL